jgi:hypothetical protein
VHHMQAMGCIGLCREGGCTQPVGVGDHPKQPPHAGETCFWPTAVHSGPLAACPA